ncbi:MAG: aldehyde dehydrogenase family protein [Proteobacteria bacterium]|nr:aldehyde dehydrogenase family protein [Pseudomonadota bacterium]MBU1595243.1 aldehyde dehydrogenase family protein [Pseudomonadota bacterium]
MQALDAACRAFDNGRGVWPIMSVAGRINAVEDFARRMAARREQEVGLMSWEICKSLSDCGKEFDRTVDYSRDTVEALKDLDHISTGFVMEVGILGQIRRSPLGVVFCLGPFNYPLNETFTTLIPALIMGNTVLMKTPKIGKMLIFPLLECFCAAFPASVINVISGGREMLAPIMSSGRVNVLAFIGTNRAADAMQAQHPKPHRLRCMLGLEAKNAAIVLADADLDQAVVECLRGALTFNGQRCTAIKMIHVARERADEFLELFCAGVTKLRIGYPGSLAWTSPPCRSRARWTIFADWWTTPWPLGNGDESRWRSPSGHALRPGGAICRGRAHARIPRGAARASGARGFL